tara:strand:+ start:469 stop:756 length:288 start_codon:yes stop_codon:yes gene_type:complete
MIAKAIKKINPNAKFHCIENDINSIQWSDDTKPIPTTDIQDKINELQAEYDANQYQRDRAKEYPLIVDQLDDIYHNGIDGWKQTIKAVKDKYPKG